MEYCSTGRFAILFLNAVRYGRLSIVVNMSIERHHDPQRMLWLGMEVFEGAA